MRVGDEPPQTLGEPSVDRPAGCALVAGPAPHPAEPQHAPAAPEPVDPQRSPADPSDPSDRLATEPRPQKAAHLTERLQERYPTAPAALVDACVDAALDHYRDARVRSYLPVLLERWAGRRLAQALAELDDPSPSPTAPGGS